MSLDFSNMGNCLLWMKSQRKKAKSLTVAILGIDNAGKTVTVKGLKGDTLDDVAPTIGFQSSAIRFGGYDITIFDLGGGQGIRGIWSTYYAEVYGLVFVIDSSATTRTNEAKCTLENVLSDGRISGKPVLILANKQDVSGALDDVDLCDLLSLEKTVNLHKTPCRVESCSAVLGQGRKLDKGIRTGFKWLITAIEQNYAQLHQRVTEDTESRRAHEEQERRARLERVRIIRQQREAEAQESPDETEHDVIDSDPFKPVDLAELTAKEERLKEKQRKAKLPPIVTEPNVSSGPHVRNAWQSPAQPRRSDSKPPEGSQSAVDVSASQNEARNGQNEARNGQNEARNGQNEANHASNPSNLLIVDLSSRTKQSQNMDAAPASGVGAPLSGVGASSSGVGAPSKIESLDGNTDEAAPPKERKRRKKKKPRQNQTEPLVADDDVITARSEPSPSTWLAPTQVMAPHGDGAKSAQVAPPGADGGNFAVPVAASRGGRLLPKLPQNNSLKVETC